MNEPYEDVVYSCFVHPSTLAAPMPPRSPAQSDSSIMTASSGATLAPMMDARKRVQVYGTALALEAVRHHEVHGAPVGDLDPNLKVGGDGSDHGKLTAHRQRVPQLEEQSQRWAQGR
jgi:hypothetical protein